MDTSIYSEKIISRKEAKSQGLLYYFTGKSCKHGHICKRITSNGKCNECGLIFSRTYSKQYRKTVRGKTVRLRGEYRLRRTHTATYLLNIARQRAKRKGLQYCLTKNDIIIPEICPALGIPILVSEGKTSDNSPNIDRIDNTKGYIPGNVHVISCKANRMKNNATVSELEMLVAYLKSVEAV